MLGKNIVVSMTKEKLPKDSIKPKIIAIDRPALDILIDKINKEYAVVLRGSQVLVMRHWSGEDDITRLAFLSTKDFHTLIANTKIFSAKLDKMIPVSPLWLSSDKRKQYEDIYFRPCDKEYKTRYNLWQGFGIEEKAGGNFQLFLDHILNNICQGNESYYNWIIDWLADLIQKPWRKPGTAIILKGEMGVGKGAFAKHIGKLFGVHYIPILHGGQLTGRFNHHLADKVFVFVDESGWSQDKYGAGILRGLITESHIAIEMKGKDTVTLENFSRFVIAANNDWVVPTSMQDERRMACFNVGNGNKQDSKFFADMQAQMGDGGYEALLHFLKNHKYEDDTVRTIPQTEALKEQKLYSMPTELKWWLNCIEEGKIGDFIIHDDVNNDMETTKFYTHYVEFCQILKSIPIAQNELPKKLAKYIKLEKIRKITLTGRQHFYSIHGLLYLRQVFEQELGQKYDFCD